jgi:hypothetical protein
MWFRKIFALLLLAAVASEIASAVPTEIRYIRRDQGAWNQYVPLRVTNVYQTIIGLAGTTRFNQGQAADSKDADNTQSYALTFNAAPFVNSGGTFAFKFINASGVLTTYSTARVGSNGWIAFGSAPTTGIPDLGVGNGAQLIAPYWSDVQPRGVLEGGVYWRVDGTSPNRVLTVEWRVQGVNEPTRNPGNFQAKLYETVNKITFYYGPSTVSRSRIPDRTRTFGAIVGLKNQGWSNASPGLANDAEKYAVMTDPDMVGGDTIAILRTRSDNITICDQWNWSCFPTPTSETDPNFPTITVPQISPNVSQFWHYKFPTLNGQPIGYSFSPVTNDVLTDTIRYNPARPGNAYVQNAVFELQGRFVNVGSNSRQNVPVRADIYRGNTLIDSRTGVAFPTVTTQGGTSTVVFSPLIGAPVTSIQGTYTIRMYTLLAGDEDRSNDTLTSTFYISYDHDFLAVSILDPKSYTPTFPQVYAVGSPVVNEARFLNIGTAIETDVPTEIIIFNASGTPVFRDTAIARGQINPVEFRDVVYRTWTPTTPGTYYIRAIALLAEDRQRSNDTIPKYPALGQPFIVRYEVELEANANLGAVPSPNGNYPVGRPLQIRTSYRNNGIVDAANIPGRLIITGPAGDTVYNRTAPGQGITTVPGAASGLATSILYDRYPAFIPTRAGVYCVTSIISDQRDALPINDTIRYCFNVKAPLSGTIFVGIGERFQTIQEANDSLFRYGVSGPVNFKLVNDAYELRPANADTSLPALDARGDVYGGGPNNPVTWSPVDGKTDVRIVLKSPSGIGIMYGQRDTLNPTGYITWDGGANKALHFILDTMQAPPAPIVNPSRRAAFFFSQGSSNFAVKNSRIEPANPAIGLKNAVDPLPIVQYNRGFNNFNFTRDERITISTGILLRNSAPTDVNGANPAVNGRRRDTLVNQNNTFSGNDIRNFGYGITSIGAGPLLRILGNTYYEYLNRNNKYLNNTIDSVTRAGILLAFEDSSEISNNTIRRVRNLTAIPHAVGIWVTGGGYFGAVPGDSVRNRAYSTNLRIERNRLSAIRAQVGNGAAIWAETPENVFTSGASTVFRFPLNSRTNYRIWNNFAWDYLGRVGNTGTGLTAGVALTTGNDTRIDFVTGGNMVENNTIFNQTNGTGQEYGVVMQRNRGSVRNNIIALTATTSNPIGIAIQIPNDTRTGFFGPGGYPLPDTALKVDYNLYWVPNGFVGALQYLSTTGFNIPSPPTAKTLNQWRALTSMDQRLVGNGQTGLGLDQNSVEGNITTEFVSTTPGSEDLHIRTGIVGSLANNRGINIPGMVNDIDGDPRGSGLNAANFDIGADEFNGVIRNNDLAAEDVMVPFGYRASTGQYSDAEYVMGDSVVQLRGRFRNVAGLPIAQTTVRMVIERFNGTTWVPVNGSGTAVTSPFNVAQARDIDFGTFRPQTLREVNQNDPFYGTNPNVTPLYRFRIVGNPDDFVGNNTYEKTVRFYVPRSTRHIIVSVEKYLPALTPSGLAALSVNDKANKLNTDSLLMGLTMNSIYRADGLDTLEDYDLFERDKWPKENLNFRAWRTVMWEQAQEPQGLEPEERFALKTVLNSRDQYNRSSLIIAGQDIARIHDVALTSANGAVADQDFVRNYLRAENRGATNPANYSNRRIRGVTITPGKYEIVQPTVVAGDTPPFPGVVRPTLGDGIARATHFYYEQVFLAYTDSIAGIATAGSKMNVVYYAIDWRHYGRFAFESLRSGVQRLVLGALDFVNQNGGVLPVETVSFDATVLGKKAVRVNWETASETNVASLEIERAEVTVTEQGEREGEFTFVARKSPQGTASRGARYDIVDQNVKTGATYRYRLVSVDLDGSRKVAGIDQVKITDGATAAGYALSIQPNPARSQATINVMVPEDVKTWNVQLYDAAGRLVKTLDGVASSMSSLELNVSDLASGAYTVRLNAGSVNLTEKLTIQK